MGKEIHTLCLNKTANEPWGFRIIGGKDEGITFKIEKVVIGSPAQEGGLLVRDFLISVNGQEVLDLTHKDVVQLVKGAGNSLNLSVERGDFIVPNFEEIWPTGKGKSGRGGPGDPEKGINHVLNAMNEGYAGCKNNGFTTVGKPKIDCKQFDNPIQCYSDEVIAEMSEQGSWKMVAELAAAKKREAELKQQGAPSI